MKRDPLLEFAFTLLELLTVISIIAVLAGLILAGAGYAQKKAAGQRAAAEISAFSAALESYKADNGDYPRVLATGTSSITDLLDARVSLSATSYQNASLVLYQQLSGDTAGIRTPPLGAKVYFEFKPDMLYPLTTGSVQYISDPFGNSYGYSTANSVNSTKGYNPTFDLWSTNGQSGASVQVKWITNW